MSRRLLPLATALLALVGCSSNPARRINAKAPPGRGMSVQTIKLSDGSLHKCSVFLPYDYDGVTLLPAIIFLQGLGEGGDDGVKNTTVGLGPAIAKRASSFPFVAIFPQSKGTWSTAGAERLTIDVLDACLSKYKIDPKRVYLTGLSTGGYGAWSIGAKHADRFAAIVPLCAYSGEEFASKLTRMPVWAFHNSLDPFVLAASTKGTVAAINKLGGRAKQTIYGAIGHDCWSRAYGDEELWEWLAKQRR